MVLPEGTQRYELAMGDISSGAAPFHRAAPVYPPSLLASCPSPVDVQALLIVNQAGKVDDVRVADEAAADATRRLYIDAVRAAARQWDFSPSRSRTGQPTPTARVTWSAAKRVPSA